MKTDYAIQTSLDLETLDVVQDAHIASIGYSIFNLYTGEILLTKELMIDMEEAQPGRSISGSTVKWWLKQSDDARNRITRSYNDSCAVFSLSEALLVFSKDIDSYSSNTIWGNGSIFDVAIVESAFNSCSMFIPWKFFNVRDMRTIVAIAENLGFDKQSVKREGVYHSSGDDAKYQAQVISSAYRYMASNMNNMVSQLDSSDI